jgi:hypothetical protein
LLVTRFAMDDAYPSERAEAQALVESCADCASLAADIRLISTSVSRLPHPARPRDFSITAEQAEQLKGSRLTRWLRSLGTPGWAALRPVAGVALSIGLVMAVVGAALPRVETSAQLYSGAVKAPSGPAVIAAPSLSAEPPDIAPPVGASNPGSGFESLSSATQDPVTRSYDNAYVPASAEPGAGTETQLDALPVTVDPTRGLLIIIGLAVASLSFGLLALAGIARRYFADPLLR